MKFNSKTVNNSLFAFFIFGSLFITFRVLLFGSGTSQSLSQYSISILPEIFVFLIAAYFFIFIKKSNQPIQLNYFDWMIIAYILSNVLLGVFIAKNIKLSIYALRMTYFPMIFYFVASLNNARINEIESLVSKIFKWFLLVGIIGLILYFGFYDTMITMLFKTSNVKTTNDLSQYFIVRMTSIFWTPVLFGTFMATTFLYFFYRTLMKNNWVNYLFQTILISCIFLSVSRGPMMVSAIGVLILFIYIKKWKVLFISTLLAVFVFIAVSFYVSHSYKAPPSVFIKWLVTSTTETAELKEGVKRVDMWSSAVKDIQKHPGGIGLGKAGHVGARFFDSTDVSSTVPVTSVPISETLTEVPVPPASETSTEFSKASTDGWFLKLANETGVLGLIFYFTLSITLFINSIKYLRKNRSEFYAFLFTIFIIVNIQNVASNVLDFYLFSYLYWFLIGLMVLQIKSQKTMQ